MCVHRFGLRLFFIGLWLCLLVLGNLAIVQAQGNSTSIEIGQNAAGELTAEINAAEFTFVAAGGESATIQVLALSPDFHPRFRVLNPSDVEILAVANPDGLAILSDSASFDDAGSYTIEVSGENGSTGQFVLSLQPGTPQPQAVDLSLNQLVSAAVGNQTPVRDYQFATTTADHLCLIVLAQAPSAGVLISLHDEDAHKTIASNDAELDGVEYHLPSIDRHYRLEVRANGEAGDTAFSISLGICGGLPSSPPNATPEVIAVSATPTTAQAACTVASGTGGTINVRSGPGTQYAVVASLAPGQSYPVLGQYTSGGWYQVSVNGQTGWVAASVTRLDGDCGGLALVAAPAGAQLAPTQPPVVVQPPPPTTASSGGTAPGAPTATSTTAPTTVPLPDLIVSIDKVSWDPLNAGYLQTTFTVTNNGSAASPLTAADVCYDTYCAVRGVGELYPGFSIPLTVSWPYGSTRLTTRVTVTVDLTNGVAESNEDNNTATYTFIN